MEYYVTYNDSPIARGNQEFIDKYFNKLLEELNCPLTYEQLDEFVTLEFQYHIEFIEGISEKEFICNSMNISSELYDKTKEWMETENYKEYSNHEVSCEPF